MSLPFFFLPFFNSQLFCTKSTTTNQVRYLASALLGVLSQDYKILQVFWPLGSQKSWERTRSFVGGVQQIYHRSLVPLSLKIPVTCCSNPRDPSHCCVPHSLQLGVHSHSLHLCSMCKGTLVLLSPRLSSDCPMPNCIDFTIYCVPP